MNREKTAYNVLIIRMQLNTAALGIPPNLGNGLVFIGLVNDLGNDLRPLLDQTRVGRGKFRAVDGVGGGILDEEGEQGEDGADEDGDYNEVDNEEDEHASSHGESRTVDGKRVVTSCKAWGKPQSTTLRIRSAHGINGLQDKSTGRVVVVVEYQMIYEGWMDSRRRKEGEVN